MIGQVTWYNAAKFYGFINEGTNRWFFHVSNTEKNFRVSLGAIVEFELGAPISLGKAPQAINVRVASAEAVIIDAARKAGVGGGQ